MKWWGWGDPDVTFSLERRGAFWPWVCARMGWPAGPIAPASRPPVPSLKPPIKNPELLRDLASFLPPEALRDDDDERLLHAFGKSYPDLWRVRRGDVPRAPDLVVFPKSHEEVERIVLAANEHEARLIPFGGGTNIVGGINPSPSDAHVIVSLDLRRMNRLLALDATSRTATIECGALGPELEASLNARGFALGHLPDSFQFSTLGGWLATRSAGMQSDAYGKIEDMILALRMVTPLGTITTQALPRAATGPDINQLSVGSEGILGVITEATLRIHEDFPRKTHHGFLFRSFEAGVEAMRRCVAAGDGPTLFRLSDEDETELSFHMKPKSSGAKALFHRAMKRVLHARGYVRPCLMIVGIEGTARSARTARRACFRHMKRHGAFALGSSVGETWSREKFNLPYLRDFIMDRGIMVDVAETSALWTHLLPLHQATHAAWRQHREGAPEGYLGCHVSHTYETGACLYFTWAAPEDTARGLEQYHATKRLLTETFLAAKGALSHHHAIGEEHLPWMSCVHSKATLAALRAMKTRLDPKGIMNPGKLLPPDDDA